jgi:Kef-type K+ transport system membrane component KefB
VLQEGGLGVDVAYFKKTWLKTTNIAITGTVLPCAFGWLLMLAFGRDTLEGFAAGTALSSTSIGMSLMMLIQCVTQLTWPGCRSASLCH